MPFWSSKKKPDGPTKEEREAAKRAEQEAIAEERNERLLPWNLEQKVAVVLNPIKMPLIILAGVLGSVVEVKIRMIAEDTFYRSGFGTGPQCIVHHADYTKLSANSNDNSLLRKVTDTLDGVFIPVAEAFNRTMHGIAHECKDMLVNSSGSEHVKWRTRCSLFGEHVFVAIDPDNCNIRYDNNTDKCTEDPVKEADLAGDWVGGLARWHVPYSLIWMIFKLVWIPGYYIDRGMRMMAGDGPKPEPLLKLISEPTCDKTGCLGRAGPVCTVLGVISKVIRFSLLPNTLILPLTSMRFVTECREKYIIYTNDNTFGFFIYLWLMFDLVTTLGMYAAAKTVLGGKALGTMWYRCYKLIAVWPTLTALTFFFCDLYSCFSWKFWTGLSIILRLIIDFDLSWDITFDVAKTVASVVVFFDAVQFTIMIMSFLCPKLLARAPVPEWLQEWTAQPDDIKRAESNASDGTSSNPIEESTGLLESGTTGGSRPKAKAKSSSTNGVLSRLPFGR